MGGKTKQTQRTKNSARPSNSGRSAELLGSTVPSFAGFSAHSGLGIVPVAPGFLLEPLPDNFDANVDPQFQMLFRKMSKKDPVTKTKALQEFTDLVKNADISTVKAILPLWPKFYQNVANDIEHRVREATQQAQLVIVEVAGKNIAPVLKQLVPVWITSQFDTYAPAANLASLSFKNAFPANKIREVFAFCQNDIMDYLSRNLVVHTAASLCSSKVLTEKEIESKYERIVSSNLRGYALYLSKVHEDKSLEPKEKHEEILKSKKFWDFAKHDNANIRAAWYECLSSFLQNASDLLFEHKQQTVDIVFQHIADTNPSVLPHVWSCVLLIQEVFDDWYKLINFRKVVLPKLVLLLKNGGFGNATALCPHYLPFISKLNEDNIQGYSIEEFHEKFFGTMKAWATSLEQNLISKSEISANLGAFYECLRYILQKRASENTNSEEDIVYLKKFFNDYVNDMIVWSITNNNQISKYLYTEISNSLTIWSQNANNFKVYSTLMDSFWRTVTTLVATLEADENINNKISRLLELINSLHVCTTKLHGNRVKFLLDDAAADKSKESHVQINTVLRAELRPICVNLAKILIHRVDLEGNDQHIIYLKTLCEMFNDVEFYNEISDKKELQFTLTKLKSWLLKEDTSEVNLDIIFEILRHLNREHRVGYLCDLLKVNNKLVQQWTLQRLLSYPLCLEPDTRNLLSEEHASEIILRIAKDSITDNSKEKLNLLQKCFFQNESGEILIGKDTVYGIIDIVSEPLVNENYIDMMDTCASFIAQIMPVICSKNSTTDLQREVFLKLFKFSVNMSKSNDLSEDTLWEITTCWQDALSSGDIELDEPLMKDCATLIYRRLLDGNLLDDNIVHIAKIAFNLIVCSNEDCANEEERDMRRHSFLKLMLLENLDEIASKLKHYCLYVECLQDSYTPQTIGNLEAVKSEDIKSLFLVHYFHVSLIFLLTSNTYPIANGGIVDQCGELSAEDADDDNEPKPNVMSSWSEEIYEYILKTMEIAAIGSALTKFSDMLSNDVEDAILNLTSTVDVLLNDISEDHRAVLEKKIVSNIAMGNELSCKLLPFFINMKPYIENECGPLVIYENCLKEIAGEHSLIHLHVLQALLPVFPARKIPIKAENFKPDIDILVQAAMLRVYIRNYFSTETNDISDKTIIRMCHELLSEIAVLQKSSTDFLLYNQGISEKSVEKIVTVTEISKLFTEVLLRFPTELTVEHWDFIRIALSSWILTASKVIDKINLPQISIFVSAIYKMHAAMFQFFCAEKQKSSTLLLTTVIDEWENLFALETSLVLFKTFHSILSSSDKATVGENIFKDVVCPYMEYLDYGLIYKACRQGFQLTLDECIQFLLGKFFSEIHSIRITAASIFRKMLKSLVQMDSEKLDERSEVMEGREEEEWHILYKVYPFVQKYEAAVNEYLKDFSYKISEITSLSPVGCEMIGYLLLWDCIILACSKASAELRSYYAQWITRHQLEQPILQFLFRSMPTEILKNYDSKIVSNGMFKQLEWTQIKDKNSVFERYACHLYAQMLRYLPAVVRKWWNESHARQKTFVDKLTTNYVSNIICQEELRAITNKKEKHENMQITVHTSTREVIATYSIDEAKMELVISLAMNHPLGSAKIESEKQIGGRLQSRIVVRQLTIFLTHQNGSIFDVLSLWKKNLDKKFEGVEECYVCYSVIHQDTCQLPKLSCKTCRKKFHGPCLYKWFTTSSKSTCPICRNIF